MTDVSTEYVVLCVRNEDTDVPEVMGVFQMIQGTDYVCLVRKD